MTLLLRGKYMLERRLGGGGMAEVFLARTVGAEGFSRQVAIKRILPGFSENPQFAQMFVSEAQLTSRLQHPNVVSVLDFDRDDAANLFLVMELVDGVDLDALASTGMLPLPAIVFVVTEILRGLGYAHDLPIDHDGVRGLVHRDVSPHNVLLSWEGAVKVSDFGIAKARAASDATASQLIKGKPAYMSPEQANGEPLDGRSDLFAVGVMLWEMLCGRPLFAGTTTQETLARLLFGQVPAPRELRPDLPLDLEQVTMRLLARERAYRYANADAAIADLIACRDQPRNGRELLVTLLADRFAGRAPKRARSIASAGPAEPTRIPVPGATTVPSPVPMRMVNPVAAPTSPVSRRVRWAVAATVIVIGAAVGILAATWRSAGSSDHGIATRPADAAVASDNAARTALADAGVSDAATMQVLPGTSAPSGSLTPPGSGSERAETGHRDKHQAPKTKTKASGSNGIQEIKLGSDM